MMIFRSNDPLRGERTITVDKESGNVIVESRGTKSEVVVPEKFKAQLARVMQQFGESRVMADDLKNPLTFLEDMLRKARRGEIVLTGLRIKNTQPDRWESSGVGPERLRMDNAFKIELEMYAPDRGARSQPAPVAVRVEIDDAAAEMIAPSPIDYATLTGQRAGTAYRVPTQPIKTFAARVMQRVMDSDLEYNTLRITYETRDRLMLEGILDASNLRDASPVVFLGLDLIVEAPDGRPQPRFEDAPDEYFDERVDSVTGNVVSRRTLNEAVTQDRYTTGRGNVTRGVTTRRAPPEKPKPKTPAGASAAREIIFDD